MVKLINKNTGSIMWVADNRVDEYLKAGHKSPAPAEKPTEEDKPVEEKQAVKGRRKRG